MPQDALSRLALLLGSRRGVASHARPTPTPAETGPFIAPPPVRGRAPLPTSLPRSGGQRVFNEGVDALLGALGVKDALGEETPTVGTAVGQLASMLSPLAMMGAVKRIKNPIRAFHGSPHDFDQFKMSQIGTGEGAQAFGHGLYFAENPKVAAYYKPSRSYVGKSMIGQSVGIDWDDPARIAEDAVSQYGDKAADELRRVLGARSSANPQQQKSNAALEAAIARIQAGKVQPRGRLYEVNLHVQPGELLDWDAPLSRQPIEIRSVNGGDLDKLTLKDVKGKFGPELMKADIPGLRYFDGQSRPITSSHIVEMLGPDGRVRNSFRFANADEAKAAMQTLKVNQPDDIPRYVDASGPRGEGTRNYVIWDEDVIEILRKYGIVPPLAAAAAGLRPEPSHQTKR